MVMVFRFPQIRYFRVFDDYGHGFSFSTDKMMIMAIVFRFHRNDVLKYSMIMAMFFCSLSKVPLSIR